jgi:hypothetical protein
VRRRISYEQAIWIRERVLDGRMTTRQASKATGIGIESIRRIVRGDTYANPEIDSYGRDQAQRRGCAPPPTQEEQEALEWRLRESGEKLRKAQEEQEEAERRPNWRERLRVMDEPPVSLVPVRRPPPDPFRPQAEDLEADATLSRLVGEIAQAQATDTIVEGLKELGEPPGQGRV